MSQNIANQDLELNVVNSESTIIGPNRRSFDCDIESRHVLQRVAPLPPINQTAHAIGSGSGSGSGGAGLVEPSLANQTRPPLATFGPVGPIGGNLIQHQSGNMNQAPVNEIIQYRRRRRVDVPVEERRRQRLVRDIQEWISSNHPELVGYTEEEREEEENVMLSMSLDDLYELRDDLGSDDGGLSDYTIHKYIKSSRFCPEDEDEDEACCICLETYISSEDTIVCKLDCDHMYHFKCIRSWLREVNRCPACRAIAVTP
ncbi:probable E3 ubiquitin-protein ligase ZFP1 [Impatiens glandulifera]|uniref:probable E3 ubiquitin-protein ligase ZFP1 n=1 Tax=Impatiens glandulifera TaxID=253017 RepID=UPI001FB09831|nr:probable E3 ubiquitin-protein ligase ZFP1 [Impatiens glandulifera]